MGSESVTSRSAFGQFLFAERQRQSLSRRALADLVQKAARADDRYCFTNEKQIRRWEAGTYAPNADTLRWLASALGKPVAELTALLPSESPRASERVLGPLLDLPAAYPADADYVESIHATDRQLVSLDRQYGGQELAPLAMRILRSLQRRVSSGHYKVGLERDLQGAIASIAGLAAWLLFDADNIEAARQVSYEALFSARLAGNVEVELMTLSSLAYFETSDNRPGAVLPISSAVLARNDISSRIRAIFDVREARALAMLGDSTPALRIIDRAKSRFEDGVGSTEWEWAWWIDSSEMAAHTGMLHSNLGNHREALTLLQKAANDFSAETTSSPNFRFPFLARVLREAITLTAWEDAESAVRELLPYVGEVGSTRTNRLLTEIAGEIEQSSAPSTLIDAGAHLRSLLSSVEK